MLYLLHPHWVWGYVVKVERSLRAAHSCALFGSGRLKLPHSLVSGVHPMSRVCMVVDWVQKVGERWCHICL